ncbi:MULTISPECIES: hypothetical protein [unclassified Streptomyces]|uniref:hypothetical protein n=1 Tax=unclassified Streptomyces TaxID=2593676 RepID=UPI00102C75AD|nr:hypothetical protein [Streptomyces sp. BK239]RZU24629.1 hypothetical protein EV567_0082 [Streptomyces sp. BK239]
MPRPTVAQLTYGSCTVVFSTLAMLLLSQTSSGPAVAVIAVAAVALGVLVAMTVPAPRRTPVIVARSAAEQPAVASVAAAAPHEAVREPSAR